MSVRGKESVASLLYEEGEAIHKEKDDNGSANLSSDLRTRTKGRKKFKLARRRVSP